MTRLLLLSCSASKDPRHGLLPAEERYTGVFFRVVARAKRENYWPGDLELAIVSARYGLLSVFMHIRVSSSDDATFSFFIA